MKRTSKAIIQVLVIAMVFGFCTFMSAAEEQQVTLTYKGETVVVSESDFYAVEGKIRPGAPLPEVCTVSEELMDLSFTWKLASGESVNTLGQKHLVITFDEKHKPTGTLKVGFKVTSKISECAVGSSTYEYGYTGKAVKPKINVADGYCGKKLREGIDYKVIYPDNCTKRGKKIVTVKGISSYCTGSTKTEYYVEKGHLQKKWIKLSCYEYKYDGTIHKPKVTVVNSAGVTLKKDTDYYVKYDVDKYAGTHFVFVYGKNNYESSYTLTFAVTPLKIGISKITCGDGSMKVYMSNCKGSGTDTYMIYYRVKGTDKWKHTSTGYTYKTIKNLKKGKKYEVKVRSKAHTHNDDYYYSDFSKIKTTARIK